MKIYKIAQQTQQIDASSVIGSLGATQAAYNQTVQQIKTSMDIINKEITTMNNKMSNFMNNISTQLQDLESFKMQMSSGSQKQTIGPMNVPNSGTLQTR